MEYRIAIKRQWFKYGHQIGQYLSKCERVYIFLIPRQFVCHRYNLHKDQFNFGQLIMVVLIEDK